MLCFIMTMMGIDFQLNKHFKDPLSMFIKSFYPYLLQAVTFKDLLSSGQTTKTRNLCNKTKYGEDLSLVCKL